MAYPIANQDVVSQLVQLEEHYHQVDVIPQTWYQSLVDSKKRPKLNAILLLAEIVYWYRLVPVYDIHTKQLVSYEKKFKLDVLQKSYKDFQDKFGLTKVQSRKALDFLVEKGLVSRTFRDIKEGSVPLSNVMYLTIHTQKLAELIPLS